MSLTLTPNLADPDAAYAALLAAHKGLSEADTQALNARLVLVLMNHVGAEVFAEALRLAREAGGGRFGGLAPTLPGVGWVQPNAVKTP